MADGGALEGPVISTQVSHGPVEQDFYIRVLEYIQDEPFKLFVVLAVATLLVVYQFFKDAHHGLRFVVILIVISCVGSLGIFVLANETPVIVDRSDQTESDANETGSTLTDSEAGARAESAPSEMTDASEERFSNAEAYLLPRPQTYQDERTWFAYIGSFSSKDNAISHAKTVSKNWPNLRTFVFLYGDRKFWGVALATWTSEEKAREAVEFARAEGVQSDAYAQQLPRDIYDGRPQLYRFSILD
ncbi:hypothetical protein SAMN04488030_3353 [Aliiroseovarius halocynthiae]|uniref:SPOR domain-containing protein n=1 Tax=Aliiroseovarius halocynthiae TaxID=985055 RepID=A0A545SLT3_9RHOB|nr:hypothetical protein [Aliiroseovarius halocynthiae]TQV65933.1 hypothetical protein FIL88_15720 [Aliiroseovarius halocynthiae]SMR83434.1 hypothetical protein SAMN04488030_3353 [Aliiroseovarius halocynthiae]